VTHRAGVTATVLTVFSVILIWWPVAGEAQTAIVKRNVNLRHDAPTNQAPIRLLTPAEELRVLSLTRANNYYHVATVQNETTNCA